MENLIIPENYQACLSAKQTLKAVQQIKNFFSSSLANGLEFAKSRCSAYDRKKIQD